MIDMKRLAFFLIILTAANVGFSQAEYNSAQFLWNVQQYDYVPFHYVPQRHVKQIVFEVKEKKKVKKFLKKYNEAGKLLQYAKITNENDLLPIIEIELDSAKINKITHYKKGKKTKVHDLKRGENGRIIAQMVTYPDNKTYNIATWEYSEMNCLLGSVLYKNKSNDVKYKWKYEYLDSCKLSKTILYNGKGNVKNEWSYNCHDEGEKLEPVKNQTQVCRYDKTDDNHLIRTVQTFDEKGKIVKYVYKYSVQDTLIMEYARYNGKDQLVYLTKYDKDYKKPLLSISYKKNGEKYYEHSYLYTSGQLSQFIKTKNGQMQSKSDYQYDDKGLLIGKKDYNKKGDVVKVVGLTYEL
jgi:hypothetical protein